MQIKTILYRAHAICWIRLKLLFVTLLSCLNLIGCQIFQVSQAPHPTPSTRVVRFEATQPELTIKSARFEADLVDDGGQIDGESTTGGVISIHASYQLQSRGESWLKGSRRRLTMSFPKTILGKLQIKGDCAQEEGVIPQGESDPSKGGEEPASLTLSCVANSSRGAQVEVTYRLAWTAMRGYRQISEGERRYHLMYLPAALAGEVFAGFSSPTTLAREVKLRAPTRLNLFGHRLRSSAVFEVSEELETHTKESSSSTQTSGDEKSAQATHTHLHWSSNDDEEPFPLFFAFGSWERPQTFRLTLPPVSGDRDEQIRAATLITPIGSQFHQVDGMSLRTLQMKEIREHAQKLVMNTLPYRQSDEEDELLFVTLTDHPNYLPPDLRRLGVVFMDEAWFYRIHQFKEALPTADQLKLYEELYVLITGSSTQSIDAQVLQALGSWSAMQHIYASDQSSLLERLSLAHIDLTKRLVQIAASEGRPLKERSLFPFSDLMNSTLNMIMLWLVQTGQGEVRAVLERFQSLIREGLEEGKESAEEVLRSISRQMSRLDSRVKPILESYLSNKGLPLVQVKWNQRKAGDRYEVRFTLSQRPFIPNGSQRITPAMWVIPICLRLGLKDNPARNYCVLLDQPERSDFEVTLEAPLTWVHPNADQAGLYLWSLEDEAFSALLEAEDVSLSEMLSLTEMSASILETSRGNPTIYLRSVQQLALNPNHPLTLDQLFTHLNQIVLYFGSTEEEAGVVKQWASSILQGVMMSHSRFREVPLNYLTQLQLAQWDIGEVGMGLSSITKTDKKTIERFLRPTSNQQVFEDDVAEVKLDQIQYPLLIQSLSGDEDLWKKLYDKLAESEDQPLIRLLVIQAMVQFIDKPLFKKTLELLTFVPTHQQEMKETASESKDGDLSASEDKDPDLTDPSSDQAQDEHAHEEEEEAESPEASDSVSLSLYAEDALELIRGIRSSRARLLAWDWFISQEKPVTEALHHGNRSDIQEALLSWSSVVCEAERLKRLEEIYQGALGFSQSSLVRARQHLRAARRCVMIRQLKSSAEAWIKRSIEG